MISTTTVANGVSCQKFEISAKPRSGFSIYTPMLACLVGVFAASAAFGANKIPSNDPSGVTDIGVASTWGGTMPTLSDTLYF